MSRLKTSRKQKKEEDARRKDAQAAGAFWLPCPICELPFGGNEVYLDSTKSPWIEHQDHPGYGQLICPRCTEAGKGDPKFIELFAEDKTTQEDLPLDTLPHMGLGYGHEVDS